MYGQILIPIDGGPATGHTVRYGLGFARALGSAVTFLHAVEDPATLAYGLPGGATYLGDLGDALRGAGERFLGEARAEARARGVPCETSLLEHRRPAEAILEAEAAHDLTVMATHSRRGLDRLLLGSVTEAVLRRSHKPHLVVRAADENADENAGEPPTTAEPPAFKRLLFPTDGSPCSEHALGEAVALAKALGAGLTLFHALEAPVTVYTMRESLIYDPAVIAELKGAAAEMLERARAQADAAGVAAGVRLADDLHGRADEAVVAAESGFDLTVMGTHGRSGFELMFLGSVTERLLRRSEAAHLVVRCPKAGAGDGDTAADEPARS